MDSRAFALVAAVATVLLALPAAAQTVVDGDTIKLDGTTYRLWGIDAPETRQVCRDGWAAGREATKALSDLMRSKTVACEAKTQDRYGRTVALCRADGHDLGAAMVESGMAWAFSRYSWAYLHLDWWAWLQDRGVHAHGCQPPWEWRRGAR